MKLTIKDGFGASKVIDVNEDLEFNVIEGQQYIFSSGFSNYELSFSDGQESISLVFNVGGKTINIELNNIVPLLQINDNNTDNPTALIINKNIDNDKIDTILENNAFNGSEILDSLEALASKSSTGTDDNSLILVTDFQSLVDSLGAAAAGNENGTTSNGSNFDSILGADGKMQIMMDILMQMN